MNTHHLHISPRKRFAQPHRLPAFARLWCGVCIRETRARAMYKVTSVIT